ncbi:hypothetical protein N7478_004109 [Penicillium angulare]|uniref:uncharacterized protein n=1 Tax=Penicillium angulare TaxID=116970 RepID=UPI00253FBE4A|nr:uncharacterized protein N7478_004109 [Penicillium angulare]KAJ5278737.1 hypothetical protein N7478_004109 [Penicillium angulare]
MSFRAYAGEATVLNELTPLLSSGIVNIWNLGVMLWDLFYGRGPFDIPSDSRASEYSEEVHMGQIISLLGPPPPDFLHKGNETSRYFDAQRQFKFPELTSGKGLVFMAKEIDEDNDTPQFVDFISRMLRWKPEDRETAKDLFLHLWLPQTLKA